MRHATTKHAHAHVHADQRAIPSGFLDLLGVRIRLTEFTTSPRTANARKLDSPCGFPFDESFPSFCCFYSIPSDARMVCCHDTAAEFLRDGGGQVMRHNATEKTAVSTFQGCRMRLMVRRTGLEETRGHCPCTRDLLSGFSVVVHLKEGPTLMTLMT